MTSNRQSDARRTPSNRNRIVVVTTALHDSLLTARFCVFWAIKRQNPSASLFSMLVREKKNKVTRKLYFTCFPRRSPWTDFHQIWNKLSCHRHNQSWQIVCQSVQGFDFTGGQTFHFSRRKVTQRYNSAALLRSLWEKFTGRLPQWMICET